MKSPLIGRTDPEKVFRGQLKTLVRTLERSVLDLLENFWEEPLRRHTHELSRALLEGAKTYGFLEIASVTRAITSLVALPMEEVISLENALREKLAELIGLLKEMADLIAA
ncbi:MAG TPA: hypothetical protein VE981_13915 [Planctomycetota bacterium]|nr:hypothetical protein [Planctomycetota bacterium]